MTWIGVAARLVVFCVVFVLIVGPHALSMRRNGPLARWLPVALHRLFLRLFDIRVVVKGAPSQGGPRLVLANHVSWLDIPVLGSLQPLSFIAKSEVAGWPVVGAFAKLQRCVFLDRARRSATAKANAEIAHRLVRGDVVVLFPEGTSSDGNRVLPFRSSLVGAARAALSESGAGTIHLQPLAITYPRRNGLPLTRRDRPEIAWYGDMDLAPHLAAFLAGGPFEARVTFGAPIPFDAATDRKRATAMAEAAVRRAFHAAVVPGRPEGAEPKAVDKR